MGQSTSRLLKLLIAIPTKTEPHYLDRARQCEATWLKDCPVDYKFFRDSDLGLDPDDPEIRPKRTKGVCQYAYDHGYDYIFRVDADTFVFITRLLTCGYEQHDYMGRCNDYPPSRAIHRTAHGGAGFFLSRRAMKVILDAPIVKCLDGKYWGDIWTGETLFKHGITCHRDTRFHADRPWDETDAVTLHPYIDD